MDYGHFALESTLNKAPRAGWQSPSNQPCVRRSQCGRVGTPHDRVDSTLYHALGLGKPPYRKIHGAQKEDRGNHGRSAR